MTIGQKIILSKDQLSQLLSKIHKDKKLIGPVRMPDGDVTFETIKDVNDIIFDYVNDYEPLKRFWFPAKEKLLEFDLNNNKEIKTPPLQEPAVIFGIRSCDLQGLLHFDHFFSGAFKDNYYWDKRDAITVISIACNTPMDTCFCICCDGGPSLEKGFDLQLTDLGDNYLVDIGSQKGIDVLNLLSATFQYADEQEEQKRQQLMQACDEKMVKTAYLAKAIIQITNNRINEDLLDEMGAECFSCGGCTHVCPMCSCFDVNDVMCSETHGERFRCWDSCQYSGFTREASGHNPRNKAKDRIKRRFYHKLSYAYLKQDGHPGCVGCGRCITVCQALNLLDITAFVKRLRREGQTDKNQNTLVATQVSGREN